MLWLVRLHPDKEDFFLQNSHPTKYKMQNSTRKRSLSLTLATAAKFRGKILFGHSVRKRAKSQSPQPPSHICISTENTL